MILKRVDYREPLREGEVPKSYCFDANGKLYEIIPDHDELHVPKDSFLVDTEEFTTIDRDEWWDFYTICNECGTSFMARDTHDERVRNYCPGCGKELVKHDA